MLLKNNLISKKYIFLALIISLIISLQKWILSYVFFPDDLSLKIIFDSSSDGYLYFAHLKSLSALEFNNSFDMDIVNLKNLSLPFSSILIPSILYSLIGPFSVIIIELIFIFFYLLTFFLLLREFNLKEILNLFRELNMTFLKPSYILLDTKINDPIAFEDYKAAAKPIVEKFGGKYLTRGGKMNVVQKDLWAPKRIVLIQFPSMRAAHDCLDSPDYKTVKDIRLASSNTTLMVLEGL